MKTCATCPHEKKNRSIKDHRRLMGIIAAAYDQWPERAGLFQPMSFEHLRSWLICKAGPEFRKVGTFDVTGFTEAQRNTLRAAIMDERTHCGEHENYIYKIEPKSMQFEKMKQGEFGRLRDAICEVIGAEIGVPADKLLR